MQACVRVLFSLTLLSASAMGLAAQETHGVSVGAQAPSLRARDQFGKEQTLRSLSGPNGLVLLFFRSADW